MANKLTEKAGLVFNVNTVKANMSQYLKVHDLKKLKFKGSQVAATAALQELCNQLAQTALAHTHKDKSGVRTLTRQTLRSSLLLHDGLRQYYYTKMQAFDKTQVYENQLPVSRKDLLDVISKVNTDLKLTPKAVNFLCFLLLRAYSDLVNTSYQLVTYANRKTLDARSIVFALQLRFADSVAVPLHNEVSRATTAAGDEEVDKADGEDEEHDNEKNESDSDNDGDDGVSVKADTKAKGKDKSKGKAEVKAKGKAVAQVDSESSDESLEESGDKKDDESSEEEVVAKKQTTKGKAKASSAKASAKPSSKKPATK
jgi:hypothetical protein